MPGDVELGSRTQVASPNNIWSRTESLWRRAGASASADTTSRVEPSPERRTTAQDAPLPSKRHSRRSPEDINKIWREYFSSCLTSANDTVKNGKPVECSDFLFLCWQDGNENEDAASAVAVPIPDTSISGEVDVFHNIRIAWLEASGRWKRYSPFHCIRRVELIRVFLSHVHPAGHCRALILGRLSHAHPGETLFLTEDFMRSFNEPESANGKVALSSEYQLHTVENVMQRSSSDMEFSAHLMREELQFTRTWVALALTTMVIAIVVVVGLKIVFPSWETTLAAGSYIAAVVTIPIMIFITGLEKHPPRNVGSANHKKQE